MKPILVKQRQQQQVARLHFWPWLRNALAVKDMARKFGQLRDSPRELWVIFAMKLLESFAVFSFGFVLVKYLTDILRISDVNAGWLYGGMGMFTSVFGIIGGGCVDNLGVRKSLLLGAGLFFLGRLSFCFASGIHVVTFLMLVILPLASALSIPVMVLGVKKYTTELNRAFAFSVFYMIMNASGLLAALGVNLARDFHSSQSALYSSVLSWIALSSLALFMLAYSIRDTPTADYGTRLRPGAYIREIMLQRDFWRFALLTTVFIGVRFAFFSMDATFPKYFSRVEGVNAPYELVIALNPILILILVPWFAYMADQQQWSVERCLVIGASISGMSPFILAASQHAAASVIWVVVLSIGEAIWGPKLYEYSVKVAPEGSEGAYLALASAPIFFSKLLAGGISGHLLQAYCPSFGATDCRFMWFVIGLITFASPMVILFFREWLLPEDKERSSRMPRDEAQYGSTNP